MEMHHVRYFLALCEEENFTRAAGRCGVSQPSLTNAIKKLESRLGGQLFYRELSKTRLTELGKLMKPHMERINQGAMHAKEIAQKFTMGERPNYDDNRNGRAFDWRLTNGKITAMSDTTIGHEQTEEEMLDYEVSDETLETAAGTGSEKAVNYTLYYCTALHLCPGP